MYANGLGMPQDAAQAVTWYRQAAEQGGALAQHSLGVMYANGRGVPQDAAQAVTWYRQAAEQGFPEAQHDLGVMYYTGEGVPQDYVEAYKWHNIAVSRVTGETQKGYARSRDATAKELNQGKLAEAQRQATDWQVAFEKRRQVG